MPAVVASCPAEPGPVAAEIADLVKKFGEAARRAAQASIQVLRPVPQAGYVSDRVLLRRGDLSLGYYCSLLAEARVEQVGSRVRVEGLVTSSADAARLRAQLHICCSTVTRANLVFDRTDPTIREEFHCVGPPSDVPDSGPKRYSPECPNPSLRRRTWAVCPAMSPNPADGVLVVTPATIDMD